MTADIAGIARFAKAMLVTQAIGLPASRDAARMFLQATIGDDAKGARRQCFNDYLHKAAKSGDASAKNVFDIRTRIMVALRAYAEDGTITSEMRARAEEYLEHRALFEERQADAGASPGMLAKRANERAAAMA